MLSPRGRRPWKGTCDVESFLCYDPFPLGAGCWQGRAVQAPRHQSLSGLTLTCGLSRFSGMALSPVAGGATAGSFGARSGVLPHE